MFEPIFFERNRVYRIYKGGMPYKELFNEATFIEYEDNDATIDYQRDEEYYSWKHK